jgi:hypothetical protein
MVSLEYTINDYTSKYKGERRQYLEIKWLDYLSASQRELMVNIPWYNVKHE